MTEPPFSNRRSGEPGDSSSARRRPRVRPQPDRLQGPDKSSSDSTQPANLNKAPRFQVPSADDTGPLNLVDPKKRSVALIFDIITAFSIAMIINVLTSPILMLISGLVPGLGQFITKDIFIVIFILFKDRLYQGRGIGKNLMGLRVVDIETGEGATWLQSAKRNAIFIVPFILYFAAGVASPFFPVAELRMVIQNIVWLLCSAYVLAVFPLECYLAYNSMDGRRVGDKFAGTKIIDSEMDFSKLLD